MCEIRNPSVIEALQHAAQAYGMKALAPLLDKKPSTLYAELNPWGEQNKAKIGLDDAIEIMRITGDFTALELMASKLDFRVVTKSAKPDKDSVAEELAQDTQRIGEWAQICSDPDATEKDVRIARQALAREADETEAKKIWEIKERIIQQVRNRQRECNRQNVLFHPIRMNTEE